MSDLTRDLAVYVHQKAIARDFLRLQGYQRAVLNVQQQLLHQNSPQAMYDSLVRSVIADTEAIGAYIIGRASEFSSLSILAMNDLENNALSNQDGASRYASQGICPTIVANEVIDSGLQYGPIDPSSSALNSFVNDNRGFFARVRSVMAIPVFLDDIKSPFVVLVIEADELRYFTKPLQETLRQLAASLGVGLSRYFEHIKLEVAKSEIEKLARHDALTNLPNRRFLEERLEQAVYRSHIYDKLLAVCMLDLDGFKFINDTHGHGVGDLVLCTLAQRFQLGLRKSDFVARLGGDEFVILIEELSDVAAFEKLVRKIGEMICSPISIDHTSQVSVGVSLGAVIYPFIEYKNSVIELLQHADYALYESKSIKEKRASFWTLYG
ncbi:diguanylate cyclase [Acidithiobacillus sp. IBUN Pt1247-S3]|uniref:diguanylate cyclase n=1 Tax=Acidithiobacillus sp. IBUN Pt1247-S3 TaxID=3166642 RepID=UPI0034E4B906